MRWLSFLNFGVVIATGVASAALLFLYFEKTEAESALSSEPRKRELPKNPFAQPVKAYQAIGEGPLSLKWIPPQMQLPDLRQEFVYFGKSGRPDVRSEKPIFHISMRGLGESKCVTARERIYLTYQGNHGAPAPTPTYAGGHRPLINDPRHTFSKGSYTFSPNNHPTPLWVEMNPRDEALEITVYMIDDKGQRIANPAELHAFSVPATDSHSRIPSTGWDLGPYKVDTTILVRQRARWVGPDLFLELYGGEEYLEVLGRERIDFQEGEESYSCFVKEGDTLFWKEGRWIAPKERESTIGYPLLAVKKVDERVMQLEIWEPEGKGRLLLSMIKNREHSPLPDLTEQFKFVGAKTWAQFIVECQSKRMILKPHDWLVLTEEGWQRLSSPQEIDAYVHNKITGPLFILDKMAKQNGRSVLLGHLFNGTRTEVHEIELPVTQNPLSNHYSNINYSLPEVKADQFHRMEEERE